MNLFLKKIILFTLILIGTLFLLEQLTTKGLQKSESTIYNNMTKINNGEINADIIINGNSKAHVQISTLIIDSMLGVNSYNLGMNGSMFQVQELVFNLYLKKNIKPNFIIQVVGNSTLKNEVNMHEYKRYAPYLNDSLVRKTAKQLNGFTTIDYILPFVRYAGFSIEIITGILNSIGIKLAIDKNKSYKGYLPQQIKWDNSFEKFKKENKNGIYFEMNKALIKSFSQYIKSSKQKGINLILVYPPTYHEAHSLIKSRDATIKLYEQIAVENNVLFLDYSSDQSFRSKDLFYNSQHLNKKGAELFTKKLCSDIINESPQ